MAHLTNQHGRVPNPSVKRVTDLVLTLMMCAAMLQNALAQAASEGRTSTVAFDVASVRQNLAGEDAGGANAPRVNFPIGSDDAFYETGGVFSATNLPLLSFLIFAYKIDTNNRQALVDSAPEWVKSEHYNIEARTDLPHVTKDQMREMMQSLLVDRFNLKVRHEEREVNVLRAVLEQPGRLGQQLRPHPADSACPKEGPSSAAPPAPISSEGFPEVCGRFVNSMLSNKRYHRKVGGGGLTMSRIVSSFTGVGSLGKPVVDGTGLPGTYDFYLDFLPPLRPESTLPADAEGPEFTQAVKSQLGLRLIAGKATLPFVKIEHIEHSGEN